MCFNDFTMSCHIIRTIRLAHCKRGPDRCEHCHQMDAGVPCLLDICPPDPGMVQRRVIEVAQPDGSSAWCEYDVMMVFESADAARAYAEQHGIEDVVI
jgi:hypothetical protein